MSLSLKPLEDQVIVVTGASSGIGMATALTAAAAGASVVLVARSGKTLTHIADAIQASGGQALAMPADVADRQALEEAARQAIARFGRIDTWVNDAGVSIYGRLEALEEADYRRLFDTNVWGVINGSLVALPHLRRQGGALINVGSEVSDIAVPMQGLYSASKHAVKGFTDALRVELADEGVDVSVTLIQPTAVNTPYPQHARNLMSAEAKLPTPMIEPEKVAHAILDAAVRGGRDVKVGAAAHLDTMVAKIAPRLADLMGRVQISRQHRDEAAVDPDGALHRASETTLAGAGRIHGRGNDHAASGDAKRAPVERDRQRVDERSRAVAAGASRTPDGRPG